MTKDRYAGCLLGLALGDGLGAPHEGGFVEKLVWRMICCAGTDTIRWTDDTQMSLDLAQSLLGAGGLDCDDLAHRFASSYRWSRGYGPGTAKILNRIRKGADWRKANRSVHPDGSFGNGAAMRAPVIGLFYAGKHDELIEAARLSAGITHAHALGIEGAVLLACAAAEAVQSRPAHEILANSASGCTHEEFTSRLELAAAWLHDGEPPDAGKVVRLLGNGIAAHQSCVTALYIGLSFLEKSFGEMLAFVISCGGDADTIGAMAGAVWGASRGSSSLPQDKLARLEGRKLIERTGHAIHEKVHG